MTRFMQCLFCFLLFSSLGYGQFEMQVKPPINPADELMKYTGVWRAKLTDTTDLVWEINSVAMGKGLSSKGTILNGNTIRFESDGLWSYDPDLKVVLLNEINSKGESLVHFGEFHPDGSLVLVRYDKVNKTHVVQKSELKLTTAGAMLYNATYPTENGTQTDAYNFVRQ